MLKQMIGSCSLKERGGMLGAHWKAIFVAECFSGFQLSFVLGLQK